MKVSEADQSVNKGKREYMRLVKKIRGKSNAEIFDQLDEACERKKVLSRCSTSSCPILGRTDLSAIRIPKNVSNNDWKDNFSRGGEGLVGALASSRSKSGLEKKQGSRETGAVNQDGDDPIMKYLNASTGTGANKTC